MTPTSRLFGFQHSPDVRSRRRNDHRVSCECDGHTFLVAYQSGEESQAIRVLGRWAVNEKCPMTWYAAGMMAEVI